MRDVPPVPQLVPVPAAEVRAVAQEYLDAGRPDAAERMLGHLLAAAPGDGASLHLLGQVEVRRGNLGAAAALLERAIVAAPLVAGFWQTLAEIRRLQAAPDDAAAAARRAVALDPADPFSLFTLAMAEYDRMDMQACIAAARAALDLRADLAEAHMKLGQALLLQGEFAAGWTEYEWRYRIPGAPPPLPPALAARSAAAWDGRPLGPDEPLLLVADQGFGDVVMFARYLPWVEARCHHILMACSPEAAPLLAAMQPDLTLCTSWEALPPCACHAPLSGLPRLHRTTLATIPAEVPYLAAAPARVAAWRARLDRRLAPGLRRVGLVWAGRPSHPNDINRSVPLAALAPLGRVQGVGFVALQQGAAASEADGWAGAAPLAAVGGDLADFADTAALLAGLDLLIAVDTAVVHVAGAMGRPAWVMLPFAPDWRWLAGRADSPWYPSLRLFRPPAPRQWGVVAEAVARALASQSALP